MHIRFSSSTFCKTKIQYLVFYLTWTFFFIVHCYWKFIGKKLSINLNNINVLDSHHTVKQKHSDYSLCSLWHNCLARISHAHYTYTCFLIFLASHLTCLWAALKLVRLTGLCTGCNTNGLIPKRRHRHRCQYFPHDWDLKELVAPSFSCPNVFFLLI